MRVEIGNDRSPSRPDPVAEDAGVFASLAPEEMSRAERMRNPRGPENTLASAPPQSAPRLWTPRAILDRVTQLYARFTKPPSQGDPRS